MKKIKEYCVLVCSYLREYGVPLEGSLGLKISDFTNSINKNLSEGWSLYGDTHISQSDGEDVGFIITCLQPMVKYDTE